MKRIPILIFIMTLNQYANSQDYNVIYYNSNWEVTSVKFGKYYRISGFDQTKMTFDSLVLDHYMYGGLEMTGNYSTGLKEGEFIYYYPNNTLRLKTYYKNNMRSGSWTEYFENGEVHVDISYDNNKERLMQYKDTNGISMFKNGNGKFTMIRYYNPYFESFASVDTNRLSTKQILLGNIKNGYKNGIWTLTEYNKVNWLSGNEWITKEEPRKICIIKYKDGEFLEGTYFLQDGIKKDIITDIFTYLILEPDKIVRTESIFFEPGQLIKHNYLIETVQNKLNKNESKTVIDDESQIIDFFNSKYSLTVKNCTDTFRINLSLKIDSLGKVTLGSINPKIPSAFEKEVNIVINKIDRVNHFTKRTLDFVYRVWCTEELDYKK